MSGIINFTMPLNLSCFELFNDGFHQYYLLGYNSYNQNKDNYKGPVLVLLH